MDVFVYYEAKILDCEYLRLGWRLGHLQCHLHSRKSAMIYWRSAFPIQTRINNADYSGMQFRVENWSYPSRWLRRQKNDNKSQTKSVKIWWRSGPELLLNAVSKVYPSIAVYWKASLVCPGADTFPSFERKTKSAWKHGKASHGRGDEKRGVMKIMRGGI